MTSLPITLAPFVDGVWGYDVDLGAPGTHRGLPSTALTVVLALDEPLDCGWADAADSRAQRWATVSGLHVRPAVIHHRGLQRGVQLSLTTSGARALLGASAPELAGRIVDLATVAPDLADLPERLSGLSVERAREAVVRCLVTALGRHGETAPRAEVGRALHQLSRGASVQRVADEVGFSRRRLSTLVRQESGVTPKQYQRVARFAASRLLVGHRPMAEVAVSCGYADQAHLSRDWADLAGCPPGVWLREEFPFLQDRVGADPAS